MRSAAGARVLTAVTALLLSSALARGGAGVLPPGKEAAPKGEASGTVEAPAPPIEWLPWGAQAFERARKEEKGILLTIVSDWCRPCAATDNEIYNDPGVRSIVLKRWIPVRVDRDERPDIDARYQLVVSWYTHGKTGLPVTAFLFHTGEAMWADTYIALEDQEGHPGLRNLLVSSYALWRSRFQEAQQNVQFIQMGFDLEKKPVREVTASPEFLSAVMDATIVRADHTNGGFGDAPRLTNPYDAELVLLASMRRRDEGLRRQASGALNAAIDGAGYDRIGGGFHRVARDASWSVAFWDKPLSVNAAYLAALTDAFRATKEEGLAAAAGKTIDYILGTLASPGGGFHDEQRASSDLNDAAAYYTWKVGDVKARVTAEDLKWAKALFGFREEGEVLLGLPPRFTLKEVLKVEQAAKETGQNPDELRETARRITAALAEARRALPAPPVSERRCLDSTALAASALLEAGAVLDRVDAIDAARKAIDSILIGNPDPAGGIRHRLDGRVAESPILMEDQVYFGAALLDAHEVTGEARYLDAAKKVSAGLTALFLDRENGGFYDILPAEGASGYLRLRRKPMIDTVNPSPAGAAALFLLRLGALTGDEALRPAAAGSILWASTHLPRIDERSATIGLALDAYLQEPVRITVSGAGRTADSLLKAALRAYAPGRVIVRKGSDAAAASVCFATRCKDGIVDPGGLAPAVGDLRREAPRASGSVAAP